MYSGCFAYKSSPHLLIMFSETSLSIHNIVGLVLCAVGAAGIKAPKTQQTPSRVNVSARRGSKFDS